MPLSFSSPASAGKKAVLICQFERDPDDRGGGGSFRILACRSHKSDTQLSPIDHPPTHGSYTSTIITEKEVTFLID